MSWRHRVRRGGTRRPFALSRIIRRGGLWSVAVWLLFGLSTASAHGGVPTVQLDAERINPGGTIGVLADMTGQGAYEVLLVAPANAFARSLGTFEADYEGHVQIFLLLPADVAVGQYRIAARNADEEASAPIEIVGGPSAGEGGQPLGQDEAFAPVPSDISGAPRSGAATDPSTGDRAGGSGLRVALPVVGIAVLGAFLLGSVSRRRAGRSAAGKDPAVN
jgi:hypothetical protein